MKKPKISKGEWLGKIGDDYVEVYADAGQTKTIVQIRFPTAEDYANARLIAAAPELLQAAQDAFTSLQYAVAALQPPAQSTMRDTVANLAAAITAAIEGK